MSEMKTFSDLGLDLSTLRRVDEYVGPTSMAFYHGTLEWAYVATIAKNEKGWIAKPKCHGGYQHVGIFVDASDEVYIVAMRSSLAFVMDGTGSPLCEHIGVGKPGWVPLMQLLKVVE